MMLFKEDMIMDNFSSQGTSMQERSNIQERRTALEHITVQADNETQQREELICDHNKNEFNSESNTLEHAIQSNN